MRISKKRSYMTDKRDDYLAIRCVKSGRHEQSKNILSIHVVRYYFGIVAEDA